MGAAGTFSIELPSKILLHASRIIVEQGRSKEMEHMTKIKGLIELTKKMDQLSKFAEEVEGELTTVSFDPTDPGSIEIAINEMEAAIDQRAASYENNDMVAGLVEQMKASLRDQILEKAANARVEGEND